MSRIAHLLLYCSVVREINKINERELELGVGTASWHDEYKGGTRTDTFTLLRLTMHQIQPTYSSGAFIMTSPKGTSSLSSLSKPTVACSFDRIDQYLRYGEVVDVNLPRDKETGKTKGFGFLMYEDQRSTILAVDNLNGATVLDRTLRVDHVKKYKQPRVKDGDGEWQDREEQSLNAKPEMIGEWSVYSPSSDSLIRFSRGPGLGVFGFVGTPKYRPG
jgi:RNA-binding motif protein, X-linked 2